jgi:hypothetical protein
MVPESYGKVEKSGVLQLQHDWEPALQCLGEYIRGHSSTLREILQISTTPLRLS